MAFIVDMPPAEWVGTEEDAIRLLERLPSWDLVGIDTETTGLDKFKDRIYYWSLANDEESYCLPHTLLHMFKSFIEDRSVEFANQNANFDAHMFANHGISYAGGVIAGNRNDPMVMHALYKDDDFQHGLEWIGNQLLGIPKYGSYKGLFGKASISEIRPGHELFNEMVEYAAWDAWLHIKVTRELKRRLQSEDSYFGTLWDYYKELECPLHDVIFNMERRGVLLDVGYLAPKRELAQKLMDEAERSLAKLAGRYVNPSSPKQMQKLFYEDFKLPVLKKTPGGQSGKQTGSTDMSVMREWSYRADEAGEASRMVLQYRKHQKLKSTYIEGLLERMNKGTGRVHGTFTQHVTRTGRLSGKNPNLMNIPRTGNDPYGIRKSFVAEIGETARDDWVMLCADYSQLEMMLAASNCGDAGMLEAIHAGRDLHCNTASLMFGIPYEDMYAAKRKDEDEQTEYDKELVELRQQAKTIGFGVLYGEGPKKLSEQLGVEFLEAKRLQKQFFGAFPKLKRHIDKVNRKCENEGLAETLLGRKRRLSNARNQRSSKDRYQALRQAFNFTVQGFAAEIAKMAMLRCADSPELRNLECHMLIQVHDELIFECPPQNVGPAAKAIQQCMEGAFSDLLLVDLVAEVGTGPNWQEAK